MSKNGSISFSKASWPWTKPLGGFPASLASDSLLGATTAGAERKKGCDSEEDFRV